MLAEQPRFVTIRTHGPAVTPAVKSEPIMKDQTVEQLKHENLCLRQRVRILQEKVLTLQFGKNLERDGAD